MSARVLVVGLDAMEIDLVDRFVAEGRMPTFGRLGDSSATMSSTTPMDTLPGTIWPELNTGVGGWRSGLFYHPRQLHTGEERLRPVDPSDIDGEVQYWVQAARAGQRVLVADLPQMVLVPDLPTAVQIREWGVHDRQWGPASEPRDALDAIERRWGLSPIDLCDGHHGETAAGFRSLRDDLIDQAQRKGEWLTELVRSEPWDLASCSFGEAHCGGHQLLHLHDPDSPWHPPDTPPDLASAVADIYEAIDRALGSVIEAAGPDATVIVVASHGMRTYTAGYQLLGEVLARLFPPPLSKRALAAPSHLPSPVRAVAQKVVPASLRRRRREASGEWTGPLSVAHTKAIAVPNNQVGAVRLNLAGREPNGSVQSGADADAVMTTITEALHELRHPPTGSPIVRDVLRTDEVFGPDHHADLPDLMVTYRQDLGPIDACESARLGRIEGPVRYRELPRVGDHTGHGRWWVHAPGVSAGALDKTAAGVDLAPTVLQLLGIDSGDPCDGEAHDLAILRA